jgi:hypothetical protein
VPPKVTLVAPVKSVPTIFTNVPPTIEPVDAVTEVIVALATVAGKVAVITPELALLIEEVAPVTENVFASKLTNVYPDFGVKVIVAVNTVLPTNPPTGDQTTDPVY